MSNTSARDEWSAGSCCESLAYQLNDMRDETSIVYYPSHREFGLRILDGGTSHMVIQHCPFCGAPFPRSLSDEWFEELDQRGIGDQREAPPELRSESWWRKRGL